MNYQSVVLDMDGVIFDFRGDDFKWKYDAVMEALQETGLETEGLSRSELDAFIGDKGLEECVEKCNSKGVDAREVWELIAEKTTESRIEMMESGEFCLFPEVKEVLKELKGEVKLGVISNAPDVAVEAIINHYDLRKHFKYFRGVEDFDDLSSRKPHPDHLEFARVELEREPFLYVGDRNVDVEAAKNAGMDSAIVKRSYSDIRESPDYMIEDVFELLSIMREAN